MELRNSCMILTVSALVVAAIGVVTDADGRWHFAQNVHTHLGPDAREMGRTSR